MSAIMMSQITVKDRDKFQDYLGQSKAVAGRYGAELVFSGALQDVLNGSPPPHQMMVLARFPDAQALKGWFDDPEYKALVPLREAASTQVMTFYTDQS